MKQNAKTKLIEVLFVSLVSQEERSKQPSLFSVVRAAVDLFYYEGDPQLGLYGAFG